MNQQELYDEMCAHLIIQGEQSVEKFGGPCMYRKTRGGNTLKCAVGFFIPDEVYSDDFEESTVGTLISKLRHEVGDEHSTVKFLTEHSEFLDMAQRTHDRDENWKSFRTLKAALKDLGKRFYLDTSILDRFSGFGMPSEADRNKDETLVQIIERNQLSPVPQALDVKVKELT